MKRVELIKSKFASPDLMVYRTVCSGKLTAELIYHPDLTDSNLVFRVLEWFSEIDRAKLTLAKIKNSCVFIAESDIYENGREDEVVSGLLVGDAVLIVDGLDGYLILNVRKYDKRAIAEPPLSSVTHGPREGFIEDLKTNLGLLERRIHSPALAIKKIKIGSVTQTEVAVAYIEGIAKPELVDKIVSRLKRVKCEGVLDIQYLQPFIEERPYSIFNQTGVAEKPDIVAAKIMEGRVAVFVSGTPMVMTVPYLLIESIQSSADYYQRYSYATFLRMLRAFTLGLAIILPGLFIALQKFHFTILPLRFLMTLLTAVSGIPFKATTEILFVIILFEIIREAGRRTPQAVGMALNIVGALVLGETAVRAGIVSSPAVMIVALSSLALYTAPDEVGSTTILRIAFTLLGGLGGLYLMLVGGLYLVQYLVTVNGYGAPYLAPFAPTVMEDMKDGLVRSNRLNMKGLPRSIPNIRKEER